MSYELQMLLLQAGDWASMLSLKNANWDIETKTLQITLHSETPVSEEQAAKLNELFLTRFSFCNVQLFIDTPAFETAKQGAVSESHLKNTLLFGRPIDSKQPIRMEELREDSGRVIVQGQLLGFDFKPLKNNKERMFLTFFITDLTNTMLCNAYLDIKLCKRLLPKLETISKEKGHLRVRGNCEYDKFARDIVVRVEDAQAMPAVLRADTAKEKRVELHLHTQMSAMDALTDVKEAIATAARFGHKAIAITDHGVVQAFPDAAKAGKKHGVKILFGMEGYLMQDAVQIPIEQSTYVVFDLETTGFRPATDYITEIGAVKIENGQITDRFSTFVDAGMPIPPKITALTGITNQMIAGAPGTKEALEAFAAFCEGAVLVAHNAPFDVGFIRAHGAPHALAFENPAVDTVMLSRYLLFGLRNHKLPTVCEHLGIPLLQHHRAVDDAEATASLFLALLARIRARGVLALPAILPEATEKKKGRKAAYHHVTILAQTQAGLKNLYRLVSQAHLEFFNKKPQIPKSLLTLYREGLLIGSACEQGELYQALLQGENAQRIADLVSYYDYLEIQPLANNAFMVRNKIVENEDTLQAINKQIVALGKQSEKPVVATCDVHFLEPEDSLFRTILMHEMGFSDAHLQAPLYLKTTDELLDEFAYLGEEDAYEVVVRATNAIAESCEEIKPYPDGTYAPKIENADEILREDALQKAHAVYGDTLPQIVQARLDKELNSIISNGFASLYLMAQRLVKKSLGDGYLVGSRGSVGSSFVATMAGITEVNPLPPHYSCPACKHSDFDVDRSKYACGIDMPEKLCPVCGTVYKREGFEIPFEVFLGFHGDKTPDIDLNFSSEYQPVAHKFTEEMFGEGHAFRAGTIGSIKEKTAYAYVMKYMEHIGKTVSKHEIDRLCAGCSGVKRTTGQHPGGIVVVPDDNDILEFTPIQYPADQKDKNTITTHFDFHALDDRLVKLDILGHDDPTALKMLQDYTGIDPRSIPLNDPATLSLYKSVEALDIDLSDIGCDVGSLGIPEFGTSFVRQMLKDTRPTTMEELVRIAGLSHGTDVWLNNAQNLVRDGIARLPEVICTRDDIMNYLIANGCDPSMSFKIMERVRKGNGLTSEMEAAMQAKNIPAWYIESCKKIQYMFPRAHAVAYVMMSFRVAYYKVHRPEAFYAVYFTVRADAFDVRFALGGAAQVLSNIKRIGAKGKETSKIEEDLLVILEVVYEMNLRGIQLLPLDLYRSDATKFLLEEDGIRPPFSAVPGVGTTAAKAIAGSTKGERFLSIEDFQYRTKANTAVVAALKEAGCFDGMADTNQISLF